MTGEIQPAAAVPSSDALDLVADVPLSPDEAGYVARARSANTLRGYRSDWREFADWCAAHGHDPVPARPEAVSRYLTELARHGAKVGTMSRRISAIRGVGNIHARSHVKRVTPSSGWSQSMSCQGGERRAGQHHVGDANGPGR